MKGQKGFTLLEVLVSMTLIAVLVVVLSMALRMGINSYTRARERNTTFFPVAAFEGLLYRQLEAVVSPGSGDLSAFSFFQGEPDRMIFVTTYGPQGVGRGGIMKVVYWYDEEKETLCYGQKILVKKKEVTQKLPDGFYDASVQELNKEGWTVAKLKGVKGLSFSYRASAKGASDEDFSPDKWSDKFTRKRSLPVEIGVRIDLSKKTDREGEPESWVVIPVGVL